MTNGKGASTMRHFRRVRGDDGAAAVEFALLFPIFMILAMGTITVGTAFSRQINVTQAAREASRYGATVDITSIQNTQCSGGAVATPDDRVDCWLTSLAGAAATAAGGAQDPIGGFDHLCVALVITDGSRSSRHLTYGSSPLPGACPSTATANIPSTKFVQVVFLRDVQFFAIFINPKIHVDAVSVTPYERTVG